MDTVLEGFKVLSRIFLSEHPELLQGNDRQRALELATAWMISTSPNFSSNEGFKEIFSSCFGVTFAQAKLDAQAERALALTEEDVAILTPLMAGNATEEEISAIMTHRSKFMLAFMKTTMKNEGEDPSERARINAFGDVLIEHNIHPCQT